MKMSGCAGALLLFGVVLGGCAAVPKQSTEMRVRVTTAAFEQYAPMRSQVAGQSELQPRKQSPLPRACKGGSSSSCNELGDRLMLRHAYADARHWYQASCERVSGAMLPSGTRLMWISQESARLSKARPDDESAAAANRSKLKELASEASELRARIQGCLDTGETLKLDAEPKQAVKYFTLVCEFSLLVETVGAVVPGLEHVTESGCSALNAARAQLTSDAEFSPQLFAELLQAQANSAAAEQSATQTGDSMVFNEGDL